MIYTVTRKSDQQEVYRYSATAPIEFTSTAHAWIKCMYADFRGNVGCMSLLWGIVKAKIVVFPLALNLSLPLFRAFGSFNNTYKPRCIGFPSPLILHILGISCLSKIAKSVVKCNSVDVIDEIRWPNAVNVKPNEPVALAVPAINVDLQIPVFVAVSSYVANCYAATRANFASEMPVVWVVIKELPQTLCGKIGLSHAVSPVKKWCGQKPRSVSALSGLRYFISGVSV